MGEASTLDEVWAVCATPFGSPKTVSVIRTHGGGDCASLERRAIAEIPGRRLENRDGAEQEDEDGEDDEGVGPPQRDQDNGVHVRRCSRKPQVGMFNVEA